MIEFEAILGAVGVSEPMPGELASLLSFFELLKSNMSSPNRDVVSNVVSSLGMLIRFRL
jgi:hypothetical protein